MRRRFRRPESGIAARDAHKPCPNRERRKWCVHSLPKRQSSWRRLRKCRLFAARRVAAFIGLASNESSASSRGPENGIAAREAHKPCPNRERRKWGVGSLPKRQSSWRRLRKCDVFAARRVAAFTGLASGESSAVSRGPETGIAARDAHKPRPNRERRKLAADSLPKRQSSWRRLRKCGVFAARPIIVFIGLASGESSASSRGPENGIAAREAHKPRPNRERRKSAADSLPKRQRTG